MNIQNRHLSRLTNKADGIIRFLYCRFGFLRELFFWRYYASDIRRLDDAFEKMLKVFSTHHIQFSKKKVLELGPGNSRIMGYNLLMHGASEVFLLDKYPRIRKSHRQQRFEEEEREYIANKYQQVPPPHRLHLLSGDICTHHPGQVDLIISNSVLEHIRNLDETIGCMTAHLTNGGYMYHTIDLRDHFNFASPFLFYKYEEDTWDRYLTKEGISYTNRLRFDDLLHLFAKHSCTIIHLETSRQDLGETPCSRKFARKKKEDLEVCIMRVLVRKERTAETSY